MKKKLKQIKYVFKVTYVVDYLTVSQLLQDRKTFQ